MEETLKFLKENDQSVKDNKLAEKLTNYFLKWFKEPYRKKIFYGIKKTNRFKDRLFYHYSLRPPIIRKTPNVGENENQDSEEDGNKTSSGASTKPLVAGSLLQPRSWPYY